MLRAVVEEAENNQHIYRFSFAPHADTGIVVREFSTSTVRSALSNPVFIRHVDPGMLSLLTNYLRNLELSNGFAATTRDLRISGDMSGWADSILPGWHDNLRVSKAAIDRITQVNTQ